MNNSKYQILNIPLPYWLVAGFTNILILFLVFYFPAHFVNAGSFDSIKDTISDSDLGAFATHTIQYVNSTTTKTGESIRITFDPTSDRFNGVQSIVTSSLTFTGATLVAVCGGGGDEVTLTTSTAVGDESIIFTVCSGDTVATGTKTITVKGGFLTNPTSSGSYIVRVAGTQSNSADARVAIIDDVVVTASVDTNFTFAITGVSSNTLINGVTTTRDSTSTALSFGTLPLNTPVTMGQQLTVLTNARNGFTVTVSENQNLTASNNADIDLFPNGEATSTPIAWRSPSSTVDVENTYGHIGVTSNDSDLNAGEFNSSKFAGNFQATSSRIIMSHTGPADATTQDKGLVSVAYRIQIGVLQEAATDYTNTLTYVATPTF